MKYSLLLLLILTSQTSQIQAANWPLDDINDTLILRGTAKTAAGTSGQSLVLDGESLIELKDSADLASDAFTVSLWFNPYDPAGEQQMLAGKNRYSRNERQWSLTIEPDGKLKAHLRQNGWSTISCDEPLVAGKWHLATLVADSGKATLFLNGKPVGEVKLQTPIAATQAPITLGGIWDRETARQAFHGAVDEFSLQPRVLTAQEIAASYRPVSDTHQIPKPLVADMPLWDNRVPILKAAELPMLKYVRFSVIKPYEFDNDGYRFLHGVGLCFHKGRLYASFGHNQGGENTDTEEARFCVSDDEGKTWSDVRTIDSGEGPVGVSHGAFLSHNGTLWAFQGAYTGTMSGVHTRAYVLDEASDQWQPKGTVIEDGFWPMQQPQQMEDGNWIMAGLKVGEGNPAIVAISHGDDFTSWDVVSIPQATGLNMWGESTVIVSGKQITNISRYGDKAEALVATSEDYGRTWSEMRPSNLPMTTSKPIAGMLSSGQRYLVCTTTVDSGKRRSPLTIAVSRPGESLFSKVFVIRHAEFPDGPGESHKSAALSYPYAIEHDGKLFVGYSNSGDKSTRVGTGRELWNNNSAELAVIPIDQLRTDQGSLSQTEPTNVKEAAAMKAREEAELEEKYQAWVANLSPAQQSWEKTLQGELGNFYLPIHKREKVAGKSNAWDFVEDDPALPRVLLIGDSVSRAYTQTVRKELKGIANVHRAPANCGPTSTGLKKIDVWLGDGKWDVIHFNFGIHDRATPLADYATRLEQLVERMQQTDAKLVWANTTPIPDVADKYSAESIVQRNAAAAEVMQKHRVAIDDLFTAITPRLGELQNPSDVHFTGPGNEFLGEQVAAYLKSMIKVASEPRQ
ncbi:MAG: LamG-like jellyroll fold domain-containing protein [Planctomycetales bacterium]